MLRLSVVMATYNRAETLRRTLEHLAVQDLDGDAYEVIVIDDASPDHTREVVEAAAQRMSCAVTFLHHSKNRGPGYTQNRGIREAKAPIILLMADDIFFAPGALREHLESHEAWPGREAAVLGRVVQSPELTQSVFLQRWDPYPYMFDELAGETELPYYMFWACNISVKRDFMLEHGMFREPKGRAGAPAHEDVELGHRLHQHGLRITYNDRAWGYHYHIYTLDQAIQRYRERGLNWGEFRKYVPDPEVTVHAHLLNRHTYKEYFRVLSGPNSLKGRERSVAWHLFREAVRIVLFNRLTTSWLWRPIFDRAEADKRVARLLTRRHYTAFLHYHLNRGILDADTIFSE